MKNIILGFVVEGKVIIGRVVEMQDNKYIIEDVVFLEMLFSPQGVGYILVPLDCKRMVIFQTVSIFEPGQNLVESYHKTLAVKVGLTIPDVKFDKSKLNKS